MAKSNHDMLLMKNTMILSIGQFLPKLFSLFTLPIITGYLTTSEYGTYDLANTLVSLLIPIVTLQIQQGAFRYIISEKEFQKKGMYINCSFIYIFLSSMICYPIVSFSLYMMKIDILSNIMICVMLFSESIFKLVGQITRGIGKNIQYSVSVVIYAAFNLVFLYLFVVYLGYSFYGVMIALSLGYAAAVVYMVLFGKIYRYINLRNINKECLKELIRYSAPIVPSSISLWICNLSDRLIVTTVLGTSANGIYSVANKIPNMYTFAYNTFNLAWTETAVRVADSEEDMEKYYSQMFDKLFLFLTGCMLALMAVTPIVFHALINEAYDSAYLQIPILYLAIFANSLVSFFGGIYIALKRTKQIGWTSAAGAMLNLLINLIFVKEIGLYAASISTLVSYLMILFYRIFDLRRVIKIKISLKNVLVSILFLALFTMLCYQRNISSIIISVGFAILFNFYFNRKFLFGLLKKFAKLFRKGRG